MPNIFTQLKRMDNFSHNEKILANYILTHPEEIIRQNTKQVANACFVSVATIYRLCEKLNLTGFSELKVHLSQYLYHYLQKDDDFDFDFPILANQTQYVIMKNIKEDYEKTLVSTFQLFDIDEIRKVVSAMRKAKQIDIYTSAGNIYFAENFKFQMHEIGVLINVPIDEYNQNLSASVSDESHLAIIISFGGRGGFVDKVAGILKATHTPIVLISSLEYRGTHINPTYHIMMASEENHYHKISSFSTRMSLLYILDVLYACYFKTDYDHFLERKLHYYALLSGQDKTSKNG